MKAKISSIQTKTPSKRNLIIAGVAALLVVAMGYWLVLSKAAGFFASVSPSTSTLSGNATLVTDTQTGKAIQFNAPVVPPPTTPPVSGWPTAATVGVHVDTTKSMDGAGIDDAAWFKNNGFPGTGTATDPYRVDRVRFTSNVVLGNWDSSNLTGKWVKFTNCYFEGNGSYPTPGGSAGVFARDNAPFFIIEDSTVGVGGKTSGANFGIFSYVPFQLRRSDVFGANILVGFETERSEKTGVVLENNYMHDVWSSEGDHTDIINGNFHASHVTVRNNYMDGIRYSYDGKNTSTTVVTNGFGIYDDPDNSSAGIFENWTIDHNYIDRCATLLLATTNKSRFLDPFVLTNNTFARYTLLSTSARSPSAQSGNIDATGKALSF